MYIPLIDCELDRLDSAATPYIIENKKILIFKTFITTSLR